MTPELFNLEMHLRIVGVLLLMLVGVNLVVPRRFSWGAELARLSLFTRQVFIVHCLFIILLLAMMGILCLCFAPALLEPTSLGKVVLSGLALFWTTRLGVQFFVYSPKIWRGNRFNTVAHIVFACVWVYFSAVFITAWVNSMR